jgi:starch synthase
MYQGIGHSGIIKRAGLNAGEHQLLNWDIMDGDINMMFQGITSSDYVNTVSESYAKEILTKEYGGIFSEVLKAREGRLSGIVNGVDYSVLERNYDIKNWQLGKKNAKNTLCEKLGIICPKEKPVFSYIGRLDPGQKGLDLIYEIVPYILKEGASFILLGTGDPLWEGKIKDLSDKFKKTKRVSCNIVFDVDLANQIYSASDFLLVPSKYEPCGLIQMIAMYYGTIPVARSVGGLRDTIEDSKTGLLFKKYKESDFEDAVDRALRLFDSKEKYELMVEEAMSQDFSWRQSAVKYADLYAKILE